MSGRVGSLLRRLRRSERGAVAIFAAVGALAFIGFAAITVDVSYVYHDKRALQASAEAAALAGAISLSNGDTAGQASTAAGNYSGGKGNKNANAFMSVTATAQTVNCTGYTGTTCTPDTSSPNGLKVTETMNAPLYFARIFGVNSLPISATAYALSSGGKSKQLDVAVILDTTGSMNTLDSSCSIANSTRLDCALSGLKTMLKGFSPPDQEVALFTFPGLKTTTDAAAEYDCSSTTPNTVAQYNASPIYQVVPLSSDFATNGVLNTSSDLVIAARGGASGCTAGISAKGGAGTFYADAVTAADDYLVANGRSGVSKMIILLSDGDANSGTAPNNKNECQQGITAAANAQTAHTTIVTVAYGADTSSSTSCKTDSSPISACDTLLKMASKGSGSNAAPQWFYSDTVGGTSACTSSSHAVTDLNDIFNDIGTSFTGARLIPAT